VNLNGDPPMSRNENYDGREQSLVKHFILEKYLQRFAHIIGSWANTITYIDCFSGPWKPKRGQKHVVEFLK
jgi:three-Cys-motif partner protein